MVNEPKYDGDYATKSYVDRYVTGIEDNIGGAVGDLQNEINTVNKTYGAPPNPPYYVGNLYVDGTNLYRCNTERLIGSFNQNDWELATAYPTLQQVDSTYTKPSDFALTGSVVVNGGRITAGSISSAHYVSNVSGMRINLDTDTIDAKNFKLDSDGNVNVTGTITSSNVNITGGELDIGGGNFKVNNAGNVTAKTITIDGGSMSAVSISGGSLNIKNKFTVDSDGNLNATNANITGHITANTGSFTGAIYANGTSTFKGKIFSTGSVDISRWNSTYGKEVYFKMGINTEHPEVSGLNVSYGGIYSEGGIRTTSGQIIIKGITLDKDGDGRLQCFADFRPANIYCLGKVQTNRIAADSRININAGGTSSNAGGGGVMVSTGTVGGAVGNITLNAAIGGGNVYASGVGASNSKVKTNNGEASSINVKKNIKKFNNKKYDLALKLLNNINIYSYDYKYDLYEKKHQYGFIIDEIESKNNYSDFFDFRDEFAVVNKNHLSFNPDEFGDKKRIKVKQYNSDTLDKYLLTCIKALQIKIDKMEEKLNGK